MLVRDQSSQTISEVYVISPDIQEKLKQNSLSVYVEVGPIKDQENLLHVPKNQRRLLNLSEPDV